MQKTKIDWCDSTWNPVTGCLHNCEYCYARGIAKRFGFHANEPDINKRVLLEVAVCGGKKVPYPFDFQPTFHKYKLGEYLWKKRRNIFVCSMADLFGSWVPEEWIIKVFEACLAASQHNYLFLTKNPERYIKLESERKLPWTDNFWFGTSVTKLTDKYSWFAEKKFHWFLSVEPMLEDFGEITPESAKPEWIIVGAETGNRKDKVIPKREWIENLVVECRKYCIPIFMKSSLEEIWGEPLIQELPEQLK